MDNSIIVALLSCAGTVIGSGVGVLASASLTKYRLDRLEKKMDEHNNVIKRTYVLEEQIKVANHRIEDLEREH